MVLEGARRRSQFENLTPGLESPNERLPLRLCKTGALSLLSLCVIPPNHSIVSGARSASAQAAAAVSGQATVLEFCLQNGDFVLDGLSPRRLVAVQGLADTVCELAEALSKLVMGQVEDAVNWPESLLTRPDTHRLLKGCRVVAALHHRAVPGLG